MKIKLGSAFAWVGLAVMLNSHGATGANGADATGSGAVLPVRQVLLHVPNHKVNHELLAHREPQVPRDHQRAHPRVPSQCGPGGSWVCRPTLPRYVDNGDGTVTDHQTGLMWEKKTGTPGGNHLACVSDSCTDPHDVNNMYFWAPPGTWAPPSLEFRDYLERLNDLKSPNDGTSTPCFANHCDWRLPTIGELRSILSAPYPTCSASPCIDPTFGPTQDTYWSSTAYYPNAAMTVSFREGYVSNTKAAIGFVRAVRGGR